MVCSFQKNDVLKFAFWTLDTHKIQKMSRSSRWIYDKLHFETDKKNNAIVIM